MSSFARLDGDLLDELRWAMQLFGLDVGFVDGAQWDLPTPCAGWTVRDLVGHVVAEEAAVPSVLGRAGAAVQPLGTGGSGTDLGAAWEQAARSALRAWAEAPALSARVEHPTYGTVSIERLAELRLVENVVHRWDLARACGFDESMEPQLVEAVMGFLPAVLQDAGEANRFAPALYHPADADEGTRLLALCGRRSVDPWMTIDLSDPLLGAPGIGSVAMEPAEPAFVAP